MKARTLAALLAPALASCSLWLDMDKKDLPYQDSSNDPGTEVEGDGDTDVPSDIPWEGDCPDARTCSGHEDCDDGDPCTEDICHPECGACVFLPFGGAAVVLDEDVQLEPRETDNQNPPRIVWGGSEYGVVWGYAPTSDSGNGEVFFKAVGPAGTDTYPVNRITNNLENDTSPRVVWTGSRYAVGWIQHGSTGGEIHMSMSLSLVSWDAHLIPIEGIESPGNMDMAWTGSEFGIVWTSFTESSTSMHLIQFSFVDVDGNAVGTPVTVSEDEAFSHSPALAWNGSVFGIVWVDQRNDPSPGDAITITDIYFAAVDHTGLVGSPSWITRTGAESRRAPAIVWSGTEYGVVWDSGPSGGNPDIFFGRVSDAGSLVGSEVAVTDSGTTYNEYPSLAFTGSEYGVVYNSNGEIYLSRLHTDGSFIETDIRVGQPEHRVEYGPGIAWSGEKYALAWQSSEFEFLNLVEICSGD